VPGTPAFGMTMSRREDVHVRVVLKAANWESQTAVLV
jgi:hypothetical protein